MYHLFFLGSCLGYIAFDWILFLPIWISFIISAHDHLISRKKNYKRVKTVSICNTLLVFFSLIFQDWNFIFYIICASINFFFVIDTIWYKQQEVTMWTNEELFYDFINPGFFGHFEIFTDYGGRRFFVHIFHCKLDFYSFDTNILYCTTGFHPNNINDLLYPCYKNPDFYLAYEFVRHKVKEHSKYKILFNFP